MPPARKYRVVWTSIIRLGTGMRIGGPGSQPVDATSPEDALSKVIDKLRKKFGRNILVNDINTNNPSPFV